MYAYAADVLAKGVSSRRFSGAISGAEYTIPEGQSLATGFESEGRGAEILFK